MSDCPVVSCTFNRRAHTYMVRMQGEPRAYRWSGASSWGKRLEDKESLTRWKVVSTLKGAVADPSLLRRFANCNERDEQDEAIEALLTAAKANEGRDFGSDAHRVTERHDKGLDVLQDEWSMGIIARWKGALDAAGITIEPSLVERIVLLPQFRVCGTYDRLAWYQGQLHVIDLKTGSSAVRYPHTAAVQLALLANAEWVTVGDGERKGDSTTWTQFEPPPDVNKQRGLIVHIEREDA